jgi:hypothetical protein
MVVGRFSIFLLLLHYGEYVSLPVASLHVVDVAKLVEVTVTRQEAASQPDRIEDCISQKIPWTETLI